MYCKVKSNVCKNSSKGYLCEDSSENHRKC